MQNIRPAGDGAGNIPKWEESGAFTPKIDKTKKPFTIHAAA